MADSRTGRGPTGRYEATEESARRAANACRLRADGLTYAQIALQLGYADHSSARYAVESALDAIRAEAAEELKQIELARLDELWRAALEVLRNRHVTVSNGKIITRRRLKRDADGIEILDPVTGEHQYEHEDIPDDAPVLAAIDRLLKIQERRSRLLGLDAPAKQRVEVITEDAVDVALRELEAEVAALETSATDAGPSVPREAPPPA